MPSVAFEAMLRMKRSLWLCPAWMSPAVMETNDEERKMYLYVSEELFKQSKMLVIMTARMQELDETVYQQKILLGLCQDRIKHLEEQTNYLSPVIPKSEEPKRPHYYSG